MKTIIVSLLACLMVVGVKAQQLDLGMSFIPAASTKNFNMDSITVSTGLIAHVNFSTKKTYHVIAYDFTGYAITTFNGWFCAPDQDVYVVFSKHLKDTEGYLGIGWEHTLLNGNFAPSAFIEIGTNYAFSESYLSMGIFAPLNWTVWKKSK